MNSIHTFLLIFLQEGHESAREKHIASAPLSLSHTYTIPPSRQICLLCKRDAKNRAHCAESRGTLLPLLFPLSHRLNSRLFLSWAPERSNRERERERRTESMKGTREKHIVCTLCEREAHCVLLLCEREANCVREKHTVCCAREKSS